MALQTARIYISRRFAERIDKNFVLVLVFVFLKLEEFMEFFNAMWIVRLLQRSFNDTIFDRVQN